MQISNKSILTQMNPSSHSNALAKYSNVSEDDVSAAIDAALAAKPQWETLPFADRAAIFLKAADLISTKYRYEVMAATMLGQGKNAWQAEIDAAAELCDFLRYQTQVLEARERKVAKRRRFNVSYAQELYSQQPVHNASGVWK